MQTICKCGRLIELDIKDNQIIGVRTKPALYTKDDGEKKIEHPNVIFKGEGFTKSIPKESK